MHQRARDFLEGPERPEGKMASNRGASSVGDGAQPLGKCRKTHVSELAYQCARQLGTDKSGFSESIGVGGWVVGALQASRLLQGV